MRERQTWNGSRKAQTHLPELGTNLVAALAGLEVNNFAPASANSQLSMPSTQTQRQWLAAKPNAKHTEPMLQFASNS